MEKVQAIAEYINTKGWLVLDDPEEQIVALGTSENNETYCITVAEIYGESSFVFRINHASRLGLTDQAEYEFTVLQALRRSGVTPRPFYCDCETCGDLGKGTLFMEFLPGRMLNYAGDWEVAAKVLAQVHSQPVDPRLIVQNTPLDEIVRECAGLENLFVASRHDRIKAGFIGCLDDLRELAEEARTLMVDEQNVIVHGDPLAADFIIEDGNKTGWLVDWEAGMVSSRFVDIGKFMAHASLACETGFCRNELERQRFLEVYLDAAKLDMGIDDALERAEIFEMAAQLQAMICNCVALAGNGGRMGK